jgi:hypothetical protein
MADPQQRRYPAQWIEISGPTAGVSCRDEVSAENRCVSDLLDPYREDQDYQNAK